MIGHRWGTMDCLNKIKYHNELEDSFYCKHWTIHMFKKGEWAKIGNIGTIKQLLSLSKSMLDELHGYIIDNQLEIKWSLVLDQHKIFFDELMTANQDLDNILKVDKIKDLAKIQQKSSNLKSRITESEVFMKYLLHKEMNKHRLREKIIETKNIMSNISKDHDKIQTEEEREAIFESFHKLKKLMYPNPSSNPELEELEIKHKREIKAIKKEMNKLQDQKIQLEQELNEIKQADTEIEENSEIYDAIKNESSLFNKY